MEIGKSMIQGIQSETKYLEEPEFFRMDQVQIEDYEIL